MTATGLNNADLLQARGKYPPPPGASAIGLEVSGVIAELAVIPVPGKSAIGSAALLPGGGYAEYAVADAGSLLPVPDTIDLVEAAGLPEAAFTAWANVMDTGRLAAGESLPDSWGYLRHRQPGDPDFAAADTSIFATAGSEEKCEAAEIGAARAINYREEDFVAVVKAETGKAWM